MCVWLMNSPIQYSKLKAIAKCAGTVGYVHEFDYFDSFVCLMIRNVFFSDEEMS